MKTEFENMVGKTLTKIDVNGTESIVFITDDDRYFIMFHSQDCCETVAIEDITGDLVDLLNTPLLLCEIASNSDNPKTHEPYEGWPYSDESCTWTFYKMATVKGSVTIRWYGESNGYYSEEVSFEELTQEETEDAFFWDGVDE